MGFHSRLLLYNHLRRGHNNWLLGKVIEGVKRFKWLLGGRRRSAGLAGAAAFTDLLRCLLDQVEFLLVV
jgi:hypothetical protein